MNNKNSNDKLKENNEQEIIKLRAENKKLRERIQELENQDNRESIKIIREHILSKEQTHKIISKESKVVFIVALIYAAAYGIFECVTYASIYTLENSVSTYFVLTNIFFQAVAGCLGLMITIMFPLLALKVASDSPKSTHIIIISIILVVLFWGALPQLSIYKPTSINQLRISGDD